MQTRRSSRGHFDISAHFFLDLPHGNPPQSKDAAGSLTGRVHLAFQASDRATVEKFHAAGLAASATDSGAPGERPYHPGYYAAFLLDPDGNHIEAVHHGVPKSVSAPSRLITF